MLVWLDGALNCEEIRNKVMSGDSDFQKRLIDFLDDTISNEISELPTPQQNVPSATLNPCSVRGLNGQTFPDSEQAKKENLHFLVKNCQSHRHTHTCYKYWKRPPEPKECRFDLGEHRTQKCTYFDEKTGDLHLRCVNGLVNNFNETIIKFIRCNMDINFIGSGPSTKAVIYYITDYITKSQLQSHVAFAALELAVHKLNQANTEDDLSTVRAKKLLQKCAYAMISHQELSAQQVAMYLMEYEDHFTSHEYKNIYWTGFDTYIATKLSVRQEGYTNNFDGIDKESCQPESEVSQENEEIGITSNASGDIIPKNGQIVDYTKRGKNLKNMSLWDYISQVQKISVKRVTGGNGVMQTTNKNGLIPMQLNSEHMTSTIHGRPKFVFGEDHPEHDTHIQQLCQPEKALVPVPIGAPFPRRDQEQELSHYHRVMLILHRFILWT